jgi:hypothetical protein
LAVKAEEVATPFALVVSVSVGVPLVAKTPLAPVAGAVNVTGTPLTPTPPCVTVATSGAANVELPAELCPLPSDAVIVSGTAMFVRLKLTVPVASTAVADTE